MSVYIDKMERTFPVPNGRMKLSHMVADKITELHAMAYAVGLKRSWFQISHKGLPHYDICKSKKRKALQLGATEIDRSQLKAFIRKLRSKDACS